MTGLGAKWRAMTEEERAAYGPIHVVNPTAIATTASIIRRYDAEQAELETDDAA